MKQVLVVTMHILRAVAMAVFLFAMMAAPGFLSTASSVIRSNTLTQVSNR